MLGRERRDRRELHLLVGVQRVAGCECGGVDRGRRRRRGTRFSTVVRSRPNTVSAYLVVNGLPVWACVTTMPRSNTPETMRMNARRSRCAVSIPACTLNTTALNGSVTSRGLPLMSSRPRGGGANSTQGVEDLADTEVEHRGREDHRGRLAGEEHLLVVVLAAAREQFALLGGGRPTRRPRVGERRVGVHELFGGDLRAACGTGEADVLACLTVLAASQQAAEVAGDADGPVQGSGRQADALARSRRAVRAETGRAGPTC